MDTGRLLSDPMYHFLSLSKTLNLPQSRTPVRQLYKTHVVNPQSGELLGMQAFDTALLKTRQSQILKVTVIFWGWGTRRKTLTHANDSETVN